MGGDVANGIYQAVHEPSGVIQRNEPLPGHRIRLRLSRVDLSNERFLVRAQK